MVDRKIQYNTTEIEDEILYRGNEHFKRFMSLKQNEPSIYHHSCLMRRLMDIFLTGLR